MLTALTWLVLPALVAGAVASGQGGLLQFAYPAAALVCAAVLDRRGMPQFVAFLIWLWLLSPFVRRIADFQSGWHDPSLIVLAPYLATAYPPARDLLRTAFAALRARPAVDGLGPFLWVGAGAIVGVPLGLLTAPIGAAVEALTWLVPVAFGAYVAVRTTDRAAVEQAAARALLGAAIVVGGYGVYQFIAAPPWDMAWLRNTELETFGLAREYEVRVFSTAHSPGVLGLIVIAPIVLWMARPRMWSVAAIVGATLALALSQVRAAWVALLVAGVLVELRVRARQRLAFAGLLLAAGACAAPLVLPLEVSDVTSSRFATLFDLGRDESALSRLEGHSVMLDIVRVHPLGMGIGMDDPELLQVIGNRDSLFVSTLVQFGLVGATIYLLGVAGLLVRLARSYLAARTPESLAFAAAGIGLLAISALGVVTSGPPGILVWTIAGLASVPVRQRALRAHWTPAGAAHATARRAVEPDLLAGELS